MRLRDAKSLFLPSGEALTLQKSFSCWTPNSFTGAVFRAQVSGKARG